MCYNSVLNFYQTVDQKKSDQDNIVQAALSFCPGASIIPTDAFPDGLPKCLLYCTDELYIYYQHIIQKPRRPLMKLKEVKKHPGAKCYSCVM